MTSLKIKNIILMLSVILLTGCGHNILTNYDVAGLDVTIPLFGYPFGLRIGKVNANTNMLRGNSTYSFHTNTGTEVGSGTAQTTNVIEFSSNTQINEGNVEKILTSPTVSDEVKKAVVSDYLATQTAPVVAPVSTNTPTSLTASGNDSKMHKNKLKRSEPIIGSLLTDTIVVKVIKLALNFLLMTTAGKIISSIATIIGIYIAVRILYWVFKNLFRLLVKFIRQ